MAHYDVRLTGDPDDFIAHFDQAITTTSVTASREHTVDHRIGDARMLVGNYERFSAMGSSRVSLSISVLAVGSEMAVSLVSSGGSQAMFLKLNTFGEESFLEMGVRAITGYTQGRTHMDGDGR
ncbi:DUF6054 family protein [Nocardioides mangrovi]|uniref:DUF6054 family protein n=1 Tax=Nocardioides mangrovi TaxID=2874580 RepID=A0ABS7UDJ1_9ACTN|nr:DUF6054 family protein [Nocardioides mangrovi]MBZ5738890.1 DUF6054 family protein [Nocardioides mangrovi]